MPLITLRQSGAGFLSDLVQKLGREKDSDRPGFPGELHATFIDGKDVGIKARYLGPGTQVQKRIERGDKPINSLDEIAKTHDLDYLEASKIPDKKERQDRIVEADKKFLKSIERTKDAPLTAAIAKKAIQLKMIAEEKGLLPTTVFSGGACMDLVKQCKCVFPPDHLLKLEMVKKPTQKQMTGGLAPVVLALLSGIAGTAAGKLIDFISNKIKGKGVTNIRDVTKKLGSVPHTKQIDILSDFISENPEVILD